MGLARYRVNANVGDLRHGEDVAIDPDHPHWQGLIARQVLTPAPDDELTVDEFQE